MMDRFATTDDDGTESLQHAGDDLKPIMVMATLTPAEQPSFESMDMPISRISIELFHPLPGGTFLGGRLAPPTFKVPHMRDETPQQYLGT